MGYTGEKASLNQYSSLYEYCKQKVFSELKEMFESDEIEQNRLSVSDISYSYVPKAITDNIPLVSFDGGLATLFSGTPMELSLIKIAAACPPSHQKDFLEQELKEIIFHVFSGNTVNSDESTLKKELQRLGSVDEFVTFLAFLGVEFNEFYYEFKKLVGKWKDSSPLKDSVRELLEWALIFDFYLRRKEDKNSGEFLVIKDGSLSVNPKAVTGVVSNKIRTVLAGESGENLPVIGVVKKSRFVGESLIGRIVQFYASRLESHSFFKIPSKYEAIADKDLSLNSFSRYFLTLFGGKSIFEIQIPKTIDRDKNRRELIFDIIAENTTFAYGGSISINSFAHIKASLSEAESRLLERNLYRDLKYFKPGDEK